MHGKELSLSNFHLLNETVVSHSKNKFTRIFAQYGSSRTLLSFTYESLPVKLRQNRKEIKEGQEFAL